MRLSEFKGMKITNTKNQTLGYIYDVISTGRPIDGQPAGNPEIQALIYGSKNILERIQIIKPKRLQIDWKDVVEVKSDCIIVRKK